jgi:acyl dehydratase
MSNLPLSCLPALPKLGVLTLLRALFKRPARSAGTSPSTTYRLDRIDRNHVRRYKAAFGFVGDAVPITYLYLLAQRAQLATLTERAIPFRIPGLIHVENRLETHREIDPDSVFTLTTDVALPPAATNGALLCILTTQAFTGALPAFTCISTYLIKRGSRNKRSEAGQGELATGELIGSWTLSSNAGRAYAALSGDWNPIHLWPWTARLVGMRAPIIHGMHSVAQACAMLEQARGHQLTRLDSRFRSPIALGAEATLASESGDGAFSVRCKERIAVEGDAYHSPSVLLKTADPDA